MDTDPWQRICERCGRPFEVGLWCRVVSCCDVCRAEMNAMTAGESGEQERCGHKDEAPGRGEKQGGGQDG